MIDLLTESAGGRFWRAHDAVLDRYVALHVISAADPRSDALVTAARSSATVLDPRLLRVLDVETRDGLCFVVNEWGTGTSLDILVNHAGPLPARRAAWLVADVADAIARCHERGVTHGRLNPENILIDRLGAVRIIGLCVDAALHGLPPAKESADLTDLGGLLYCALTGTWAGHSTSVVEPALQAHGTTMAPRQALPGVPRPLDTLWCEIDHAGEHHHRWWLPTGSAMDAPDVSSARAVYDRLMEFLGDTAGLPEELASSILPINEVRPVVLPALADPPVRTEPRRAPTEAPTEAPPAPAPATSESSVAEEPGPIPLVSELPTEAGMPVFGEDQEVGWMRARSTPPPPPPPFEEPPERPLFAPDTPEGTAARRARAESPAPTPPEVAAQAPPADQQGWDSGTGTLERIAPADEEPVPGRSWLRLALAVGLVLVLVVAVAIAINLGRGRTPLGAETTGPTRGSSPAPSVAPSKLGVLSATDFDPLGDGDENRETAALAVDGDPSTAWRSQTYLDQLGPPPGALKTGVGLIVDLGEVRTITSVKLQLVGAPSTVDAWISRTAPTSAPGGTPVARTTAEGDTATLTPSTDDISQGATTGRYLLVWFTALPPVTGGYRIEVAEVVVRGH
ncbi:protein kinase family protein [Nocardioides sp. GY 10113]|uniref:protein kinase family protein n=1 Tax=Nocardioides sp. GY 10113 TaxID=2569761 RepID=UPI001458ED28|nr:protein kinase family protein [Nocardioides sp. GY 10113]